MNRTSTAAARSRCMPDYWLEGRQPGRLRLTIKRHAKTRKSEAQVKDMHPQPNSPLEESLACMRVRLPVTKKNLRLRSALLAIGLLGILGVWPAFGASKTWNGSASSDWFNANNWTPVGVPAATDTINFSSGTINLSSPVTVSGQFNWSGGGLEGSALTVASNGVMNLSGNSDKRLYNVLTNGGTVNWADGGRLIVENGACYGYFGGIENLAGGLFDIQNDQTIYDEYNCNSNPFFRNAGTLRKSGGTGTTSINIVFYNSGA